MTTQTLLDFDLSESSDDSDFRIEDHDDDSDDLSINTNDDHSYNNDDSDDDDDSGGGDDGDSDNSDINKLDSNDKKVSPQLRRKCNENVSTAATNDAIERAQAKILSKPICCACLGDRSDDANEIVECDNCGISVHEGCYGISDSNSVSSTVSSCSTEPWFCEACKANINDPSCELCPNKGGIFKETDVGKWVHLVCALYVPGVAFGEVDHLSAVTLFEMNYMKWGAKICSLCVDSRFARCGVCIGCDAGMCKTYFHVTCAQAAGLLSEAHSEEVDHADPFYAHCRIHSDKTLIKHRKRNYNALRMIMTFRSANIEKLKQQQSSAEQKRIERKLKKHRNKYLNNKTLKNEPWVPTQKIPRLISTSASACRRLLSKADRMGINVKALEFQEAQIASLVDLRKKWHIPPAFSVEFIGYYLDRISRLKEGKANLQDQLDANMALVSEQRSIRAKYEEIMTHRAHRMTHKAELIERIEHLHKTIHTLCPAKSLSSIDNIIRPPLKTSTPKQVSNSLPRQVFPTAAALKMGVGFPLTNLSGTNDDTNRVLSTQCPNKTDILYDCGICKRVNDQHLLAKCDTCHLHYHLGCLTPPLLRHPKKSKIYGWQCSECDEDNPDVQLTSGPRKSRTKFSSKDGIIVPVDSSRDVSLDGSIDEEKIATCKSPRSSKSSPPPQPTIQTHNHQQQLQESPLPPPQSTPSTSKQPVSTSVAAKKQYRKCDKLGVNPNYLELNANAHEKVNGNNEITPITADIPINVTSPVLNNSVSNPISKLNNGKSPKKRKLSKQSNVDEVIEAVSRGLIAKDEPMADEKSNTKTKIVTSDIVKNADMNGDSIEPQIIEHFEDVQNRSNISKGTKDAKVAKNAKTTRNSRASKDKKLSKESRKSADTKKSRDSNDESIAISSEIDPIDTKDIKISKKNAKAANSVKEPKKSKSPNKSPTKSTIKLTVSPFKSPTRSQTKSPIKRPTPVTSPILRSPICLPIYSPIRSPMRSPIQSPSVDKPVVDKKKIKIAKRAKKEKDKTKEKTKDKDKTKVKRKRKPKPNGIDKTDRNTPAEGEITSNAFTGTALVQNGNNEDVTAATTDAVEQPSNSTDLVINHTQIESTADTNAHSNAHTMLNGMNGLVTMISSTCDNTISNDHKHSRKRRKEKHRRRDGDETVRASSKEHKKKRKRKDHDMERSDAFSLSDGVPKIKIKFKPMPLPGEQPAESHFFYVPANMVRPNEFRKARPDSVNSVDEVPSSSIPLQPPLEPLPSPQPTSTQLKENAAVRTRRLSVLKSPLKSTPNRRTSTPASSNSNEATDAQLCDVCQVAGTPQDLVKCDECKKNYHFRCLEPPLKKTPKKRGYSWHCADCDPTDKEDN